LGNPNVRGMKSLRIADNLALPLETVTQKLSWLGVTGSGKTYAASKLAELLWSAGAQFVVLDVVGTWYGLRLAKGGQKPSAITVPIFGGLHGDIPLEPTAGVLLADLTVDRTLSCIIDLSQFETDTDKARFARDFADRFFFRKKAAPSAVHLFIEEAQELVPQNPQKGEERMLHAFIRLQKLGRNFGIGSSYISQRPQEVNKKALNMAQTLFVFRTTGMHERKAIESWIQDKALDQNIAADLPKIATGDCHVWSPEFLKISEMAHILPKETFDASATPEVGTAAVSRELAPIDLAQVERAMAATIEKAAENDPMKLRRQLAELRRALTQRPEIVGNAVPIAKYEALRAELTFANQELKTTWEELKRQVTINDKAKAAARKLVETVLNQENTVFPLPKSPPLPPPFTPRIERPKSVEVRPKPSQDGALPKGERAILIAVAQHTDGVNRAQLTTLTGYKRSTRDAYVQRLRERGFVSITDRILATEDGITALGSDYEQLPIGQSLLLYWIQRLPEGESRILEYVANMHPNRVERSVIGDETGYKRSTRDAYIQRLKARELVILEQGQVRLSETLSD
jgi:uncharacterized protein